MENFLATVLSWCLMPVHICRENVDRFLSYLLIKRLQRSNGCLLWFLLLQNFYLQTCKNEPCAVSTILKH